jgi:hypothetical protein
MPNVHHISDAQPTEFDYHEAHITIKHRKDTNDFEYNFVLTRSIPFKGLASTYSNCVDKAMKRFDKATRIK